MRRNRTRRSSPPEPFEIICQIGDRLREQYPQVRYSDVVYSDVVYYNGQQWTGHSSHEPGITKELVAATNRIVQTGAPVR